MKTIFKPTFVRHDKRGQFIEVINGLRFENLSYGRMKKGAILGNHYHKKTVLFFFIIDGRAEVKKFNIKTKQRSQIRLDNNQGVVIERLYFHTITFLKESFFIMAKSKKNRSDNPDTFL